MSLTEPLSVPLPKKSRINAVYDHVNLADAYAIDLPPGTSRNPKVLARFVFSHPPRWISVLMAIRDALVAGFGLKTARKLKSAEAGSSRIGIFKVYEANAVEVLMGEDDRHLNFRAAALYQPQPESGAGCPRLVFSTVVHCHNALGRTYIGLIAPFHRLVVKSCLRRAAKVGWPSEDGATGAAAAEVVREFWRLMASNDFSSVAAVLAPSFVLEWPQSKERIRGAERFARMNHEYAAHGLWRFNVVRLIGGETEAVSEVEVSDGVQNARAITFFTVDGGKITQLVEYWPEPYAAPANRAHLVEPME